MTESRFFGQPLWVRALPFVAIYSVYALGFPLDVLEIDSAQYAEMSREMLETGQFIQVYDRGNEYLDKPPLLFWLTALFYKLFGVSNVVFRLPSFLFSVLGNYATFRLAKRYYGYEAGYLAALMAASCQAFFMFNHDVRTDTILTGSVIFAIWQLDEFLRSGRFLSLLLGFTGVAGAMLTKGPIGLMVPVLALATDLVLKRQWRNFFRWEWLVGLAWTGLLLLPMCIGLYQQFDLHPEKVLYGRTGTSGLRFYFWTQSFGRLTGESTWRGQSDPFFFTHTFLWAFLPWSLFFLVAAFRKVKTIINNRFRLPATDEALTLGGFVLPFLAFSASNYQLPHYIFVLLPLAAVLSAQYVHQLLTTLERAAKTWRWVQLFVGTLLWAVVLLITLVFPLTNGWLWAVLGTFLLGSVYCFVQPSRLFQLVGFSLFCALGANCALNAHFYPHLFQYQAGSVAARYINAADIDPNRLYMFEAGSYSLDFGLRRTPPILSATNSLPPGESWVYATDEGLAKLRQQYGAVTTVKTFDEFHVSMLRGAFLNPATRASQLEKRHLVKVVR